MPKISGTKKVKIVHIRNWMSKFVHNAKLNEYKVDGWKSWASLSDKQKDKYNMRTSAGK